MRFIVITAVIFPIRFLPFLWNSSILSFLLSLLSPTLPCPLATFLKFSNLLLLHFFLKSHLLTRTNYRSPLYHLSPRSLIFSPSQLSERISANNLYRHFQSACLLGHSTKTALLKKVNDLLLSLDDGQVSLLALSDLTAAFDTTDHSILLNRLHHDFGIQGIALEWFLSYLTNRTQSVSIHCHTLKPAPIPGTGIAQWLERRTRD